MIRFYGREEELKKLDTVLSKNEQENILVYGRRRIGKSYLIRKALENVKYKKIIYQCKNISVEATVEQITSLIKKEFNMKYLSFNSFEEMLDFLFSQNDFVLVLDEYPNLQLRVDGLDSIIQQKIDTFKFESNMKLILSGSSIDIMKSLVEYSNPLYGRFNTVINLKEHNYLESALYYPNFSNEDKVKAYAVFGGEPYYNSLINDKLSLEENILNLAIPENSPLEMNVIATLKNELIKISSATEVLTAIAIGKRKNKDIADFAHIDSARLDNALKKLIDLDIVEKVQPINTNTKKKYLYYIKNNPVRFYFRYIDMFVDVRSANSTLDFYNSFIKSDFLNQYVPKVYESIAKQFLIIRNKKGLNNPSFNKIGTYWYDDKKEKKNGEFDVVTLDELGYIFYEVKFTDRKIGNEVLNEEIYQLNNLDISYYKLGFISKNGSTLDSTKYFLFSLDDIYNIIC